MSANAALDHCLRADPGAAACESVATWWPRWRAIAAAAKPAVERAIRGGYDADRVGWAFASGYQAALHALVPGLGADSVVAFCVTEEAGNRPRDIRTTISAPDAGGVVSISGAKRWTTLGPASTLLLVVGTVPGAADGSRPALKVAQVPADTAGVSIDPMPATAFVPEVPHARVRLDGVRVPLAALLAGDGYEDYVKPFRTVEDVHVTVAVVAYLLREARARKWPQPFVARASAAIAALAEVASSPAAAAATHVALAGVLDWIEPLYREASELWATAADPAAMRWRRDVPLFSVAWQARAARLAKAWNTLAVR